MEHSPESEINSFAIAAEEARRKKAQELEELTAQENGGRAWQRYQKLEEDLKFLEAENQIINDYDSSSKKFDAFKESLGDLVLDDLPPSEQNKYVNAQTKADKLSEEASPILEANNEQPIQTTEELIKEIKEELSSLAENEFVKKTLNILEEVQRQKLKELNQKEEYYKHELLDVAHEQWKKNITDLSSFESVIEFAKEALNTYYNEELDLVARSTTGYEYQDIPNLEDRFKITIKVHGSIREALLTNSLKLTPKELDDLNIYQSKSNSAAAIRTEYGSPDATYGQKKFLESFEKGQEIYNKQAEFNRIKRGELLLQTLLFSGSVNSNFMHEIDNLDKDFYQSHTATINLIKAGVEANEQIPEGAVPANILVVENNHSQDFYKNIWRACKEKGDLEEINGWLIPKALPEDQKAAYLSRMSEWQSTLSDRVSSKRLALELERQKEVTDSKLLIEANELSKNLTSIQVEYEEVSTLHSQIFKQIDELKRDKQTKHENLKSANIFKRGKIRSEIKDIENELSEMLMHEKEVLKLLDFASKKHKDALDKIRPKSGLLEDRFVQEAKKRVSRLEQIRYT